MRVTPPGRFTVAYFQDVYSSAIPQDDISERMPIGNAFRKTHRNPRALTTKSEWAYVWNGISCTCCILSTEDKNIHACENNNESIMEKVEAAKKRNEYYDLVFIKYENGKHDDIDKLIAEIGKISPETKVFLLTFRDDQLAEDLREQGYFAISGHEMMVQTRYDFLIAGALQDEGIEKLRKN